MIPAHLTNGRETLLQFPTQEKIKSSELEKAIDLAKDDLAFIELLSLPEKVQAINAIREEIHRLSPFESEPVDFVKWVKNDAVEANDYNPNSVAPPEMELLRLSIMADGYTQPIVANQEEEKLVVIDGFHRNRVGKECKDVQERVKGYLPVVQIRISQTDKGDRMASTIRHNRARGKHRVEAMSEIVLELKRRNWSDEKIGKNLGMDPDEVLRLTQISGLAEMFKDKDFSEAWEAGTNIEEEILDEGFEDAEA
jgi:ParB-like chromosome segregation protein Spo0J